MPSSLLLHERDELAERLWGPVSNNVDRSNRHVRLVLALCSDPALVALAALKPAEARIVEDARRGFEGEGMRVALEPRDGSA